MKKREDKVEVEVEALHGSVAADDGSGVVLETAARVDGELHDTSIAIEQEDVPAVAVALLNGEGNGTAMGDRDSAGAAANGDMPPAVKCLGGGVVHWVSGSRVRIHLQFDSGQVLPIEMSREAAIALCRGLLAYTGATDAAFETLHWGPKPHGTRADPANEDLGS